MTAQMKLKLKLKCTVLLYISEFHVLMCGTTHVYRILSRTRNRRALFVSASYFFVFFFCFLRVLFGPINKINRFLSVFFAKQAFLTPPLFSYRHLVLWENDRRRRRCCCCWCWCWCCCWVVVMVVVLRWW